MKQTARFEQDANGWWWASQTLAEDNILGYGSTKGEALVDLGHQVAGFLDFLKRTGSNVPESSEMTPNNPLKPILRA